MTLIIGIKCTNGVVLGADGAASFTSAMGQPTIMQPVKKLTIIQPATVMGVSGAVGVGQRLEPLIAEMALKLGGAGKGGAPKPTCEGMHEIRQKIWPLLKTELSIAGEAAQVIGQNMALPSALVSMLVAMPISKQSCLFQFDQQGSPCEATRDLPFFSIGSGQQVADPFLAFIRRNLWAGGVPTIADATFAAYWTLDYAIKGAPNVGIGDPKQLIILEQSAGNWHARELSDGDLEEHQQSMNAAHAGLCGFRQNLASSSTTTTTTTTPPPSPG